MTKLLIDTNALVLLVLGSINKNYIGKHRRISIFTVDEFNSILKLISDESEIITTPNIWTEVDNLCNGLEGDDKYVYSEFMKKIVTSYTETYRKSEDLVKSPYFSILGISDTGILELSEQCDVLITGDSELADYARSNDIKVLDLKALANFRLLNQ